MNLPPAAILPSRDEPDTIAAVVRAVDAALDNPHAVIIHADASHHPDTATRFAAVPTRARKLALTGLPLGKGAQILRAITRLPAGHGPVLIADTDTRNPAPALYRTLLGQCATGCALADYPRHWDEANLTNHLARPLIAATTGHDIPQPLAGDLALGTAALDAARTAADRLDPALAAPVHGYGIDAFLLLTAARTGPLTPVPATAPKQHAASFPHLVDIYDQAVPVLLALTTAHTRSTSATPPEYRLAERELSPARHRRMLKVLDALAPEDPRYDARPWPAPVADAWRRVAAGASPHAAADTLRPYYIHRVRTWLRTTTDRPRLLAEAHLQLTAALTDHPARSSPP